MRRINEASRYLVWAVPIAAVLFLSCWCYVAVRPAHAWDDAEPEILNQAWRLSRGEQIYRSVDSPPYLHTAYPPVYFAFVALLLKLTGLNYIPAKLISFGSVLAIGWAMAMLARHWNRNTKWGLWGLCFLILVPAFLYNSARVHVQMLAVALSLWSFYFILRKGYPSLFISALLALLAIWTKQTQIALPIAMMIYLVRVDRRRMVIYGSTVLGFGFVALMWLQWQTDGYFLEHIVTLNRLSYSVTDIPLVMLHFAGPMALFIALAATDVLRRIKLREMEAVDFYFISVAIVTLVSCGRLGAHTQYVVELCVVTMVVLVRSDLIGRPGREWVPAVQIVLLLVYTPLFIFLEEGRFGMASNRAAARIYPMLQAEPGPVLAQQNSFSLFSRHEIPIQLFHFTALSRRELWDMRKLQAQVEDRHFAWVITQFAIEGGQMSPDDRERFTEEIVSALRENYTRREAIYPYFIYRPLSR